MFNKLESIATSELPRTPVLGCCITRHLRLNVWEMTYVHTATHQGNMEGFGGGGAQHGLTLPVYCMGHCLHKIIHVSSLVPMQASLVFTFRLRS